MFVHKSSCILAKGRLTLVEVFGLLLPFCFQSSSTIAGEGSLIVAMFQPENWNLSTYLQKEVCLRQKSRVELFQKLSSSWNLDEIFFKDVSKNSLWLQLSPKIPVLWKLGMYPRDEYWLCDSQHVSVRALENHWLLLFDKKANDVSWYIIGGKSIVFAVIRFFSYLRFCNIQFFKEKERIPVKFQAFLAISLSRDYGNLVGSKLKQSISHLKRWGRGQLSLQ